MHPNDHVNASQSSNDIFPTAIHVAATLAVADDLLPALDVLATSLEAKAAEFAGLGEVGPHPPDGRHAGDARPGVLGATAATVRYAAERLQAVLPRVRELAPGRHRRRHRHQHPGRLRRARDRGARASRPARRSPRPATTSRPRAPATRWSSLSGVLRTYAVGLTKVATTCAGCPRADHRARPRSTCPDLQPGSTIMPGKVNPVLPEATLMVCFQVIGNDAAVACGRRRRQLRAQRGDAGDGPQPAGVHPPAGRRVPAARRALRGRHHRQPRPDAPATPSPPRRSSPRSTTTSATRPPPRSPRRPSPTARTIRETVLALGYVDRGEPHRAAGSTRRSIESMTHLERDPSLSRQFRGVPTTD